MIGEIRGHNVKVAKIAAEVYTDVPDFEVCVGRNPCLCVLFFAYAYYRQQRHTSFRTVKARSTLARFIGVHFIRLHDAGSC